jgi:hypothetical protein
MADYGVLHSEPRHKVDEFVNEIIGRRGEAIQELGPELARVVSAFVDQFAAMKKQNPAITLRSIRFERMRWTAEGRCVFDITHNKRPFVPGVASWD